MSKSTIALLAAWTILAVPVLAGEKTVSQKFRNASDCVALFKKVDVNKDGRIRENAVVDYPTIAAGFNDPEVKRRGYLTPMEFINLCFKSDTQQANS